MKNKFLIICLIITSLSFSQNAQINVLNNYKYLILKPEDAFNKYNATMEENIKTYFNQHGFPTLLSQAAAFSEEYKQCDILTCVFNSKNSEDGSSIKITSTLKFVDCDFIEVYQASTSDKYQFFSEKNCLKTLSKTLATFNGYSYKYEPKVIKPKEDVSEKSNDDVTSVKTEENLMRGNADPLKGINVANAKKEIKVGKYYALIIGIDNYKGSWSPLKNAVNDAKAIENTLRSKYKFDVFKTLYNEQASRVQIIDELERLVANVKENDNMLIYYSGHGELKKELNKGYWVPADANSNSSSQFISNGELQTYIASIKSKHTLLISDACFSGDIFRGNTVSTPFENSDKYYSNIYNLISRQAISSGGLEPVMDGGKDGHSVFAYYLLKALNENTNKYYDASQLFEKIKIPVINNSDQTPNFHALKKTDDEGGHFIFIKK